MDQAENVRRVLIGSTTEPFQPQEKENGITGEVLEELKRRNIPFILLTKDASAADSAERMDYSPENQVYLTINSEEIRTRFEKRSSPQKDRIRAIKILHAAGINATAYIGPVFPLLTDIPALFEELKGTALSVHLEAYNPKMGNYTEIKEKLSEAEKAEFERVYGNPENYQRFWDDFRNKTMELNQTYGYLLDFTIFNYDSYFNE